MLPQWFPRLRFRLTSVFVLLLGIAIGLALNVRVLELLTGPAASWIQARSLPPYVIEPPDVLRIDVSNRASGLSPSASSEYLVGPDGTINLGAYGQVSVAGSTISEAQAAITKALARHIDSLQVAVDIAHYNSKVYYVIERGQGNGDSVTRVPITGNETALDAIAQIGGIESPESTQVWIARPPRDGVGSEEILPIDWAKTASEWPTVTNHKVLPGDRVFVSRKEAAATTN